MQKRFEAEHPNEPDRRSGDDRRRFSYTFHIPERRNGERRCRCVVRVPLPESGNDTEKMDDSLSEE